MSYGDDMNHNRASWLKRIRNEGLVSTIRWIRPADRLPAYGHTVAVWIRSLGIVVRAYRDARVPTVWRVAGTDGPPLNEALITGWAELPNGPLPPPDGGEA